MLTSLRISRYRSVLSLRCKLFPLTVLVGPNGSGKSNIMSAVALCSDLARRILGNEQDPRTMKAAKSEKRLLTRLDAPVVGDSEQLFAFSEDNQHLEAEVVTTLGSAGFVQAFAHGDETGQQGLRVQGDFDAVLTSLAHIHVVPVDRGRVWEVPDLIKVAVFNDPETDTYLGMRESLKAIGPSRAKSAALAAIAAELFGVDLHPVLQNSSMFGFMRFVDKGIGYGEGADLPLGLASLGMRQFLPILIQIIAMPPGETLITEEPEISLHPRAQVMVGEFFAEAAAEGKQVIFSTHSHYLLQGICKKIRAGTLSHKSVRILDCSKGHYGTKVKRLDVDASGQIEGWIPSFQEVDEDIFSDWVRSLPEAADGEAG